MDCTNENEILRAIQREEWKKQYRKDFYEKERVKQCKNNKHSSLFTYPVNPYGWDYIETDLALYEMVYEAAVFVIFLVLSLILSTCSFFLWPVVGLLLALCVLCGSRDRTEHMLTNIICYIVIITAKFGALFAIFKCAVAILNCILALF